MLQYNCIYIYIYIYISPSQQYIHLGVSVNKNKYVMAFSYVPQSKLTQTYISLHTSTACLLIRFQNHSSRTSADVGLVSIDTFVRAAMIIVHAFIDIYEVHAYRINIHNINKHKLICNLLTHTRLLVVIT